MESIRAKVSKRDIGHYIYSVDKIKDQVIYGKLRKIYPDRIDLQPMANVNVREVERKSALEISEGNDYLIRELNKNRFKSLKRKEIGNVVRFEESFSRLLGIHPNQLP